MFKPKPSQQHDLEVLRQHDLTGLLNIQTGYGKTILSCMVGGEPGIETVLIIAPLSTHKSAWMEDAALVNPGTQVRVVGNSNKAQKEALADLEWGVAGWYIITPQLFTRIDSSKWYVDLLIVDEVHMLGNPGSKGQRKLSGYDDKDDPISRRAKHRLALSATPARNAFERMWSVMRLLWPELDQRDEVAYRDHWQWCRDRMVSEVVYTGKRNWDGSPGTATKWLNERFTGQLLNQAPCVIQHFKRERCCEFHPDGFLDLDEPQILTVDVTISAEQKKILKDLEDQALAWLEDNPLIVDFPMIMHQRLRQVALGVPKLIPAEPGENGQPKWDLVYDPECKSPVVDELLSFADKMGDEPFVVYVESQRFAEVMVHRFNKHGVSAGEYSGKRKVELDRFGKDYQVIVGVLAALAAGTDGLQKVAQTECWVQRSLDRTTNTQGEGRLDRSGQTKQVQRFFFQDDLGMFEGQLSKQLAAALELNKSLRRGVVE